MILQTFYSKSHKILLDKYFIPSIRDKNLNLITDEIPQECSGVYMRDNWNSSMLRKLEFCRNLAEGNEAFIHSDCDIQFFKPIKDDVENTLKECDIAFQHDGEGHLCAGLFCANPSPKIAELFQLAIDMVKSKSVQHDQHALNLILRSGKSGIKYGYMPKTWWTHGSESFDIWRGEELNPPRDIVAHHANWVEGVENKIKLLDHVMEKVYNGKYTWVKKNATTCGLDSVYGKSEDTFLLMPIGKDGREILKSSKITKEVIEECTKRGAM